MRKRISLLFLCAAAGLAAYACLTFWSYHNAPLYKRLERQWQADVEDIEGSGKLPKAWFDVGQIELVGGNPETKEWLERIKVPLHPKKDGHFRLEILVVSWEEDGKRGAMVQYNLVDLKSQNTIWELGRTFILSKPKNPDPWKAFLEEFSL